MPEKLIIDPKTVSAHEALLTQILSEAAPTYNLSRGSVINKMIVHPAAVMSAELTGKINAVMAGMSVDSFKNFHDPEAIPRERIDAFIANYQAERRGGTRARGVLVVLLSKAVPVFIPPDMRFKSAGGDVFLSDGHFAAVVDRNLVRSRRERPIYQVDDDTFVFTVPVVAVRAGVEGMVSAGTIFTSDHEILYGKGIYAESDFVGGRDPESNSSVLNRIDEIIAPNAPANRRSYSKLIKDAFHNVTDVSVIGAGDTEMTRDQHNIFGMSTYGKVDVYVRPAPFPSLQKVTIEARRLNSGDNVFRIDIPAALIPGLYAVESVLPLGTVPPAEDLSSGIWDGSLEVTSVSRLFDPGAVGGTSPFFGSSEEAAYSAYQTVSVDFIDPYNNQTDKQDYDVYVRYMPGIRDIQSFIGGRDISDPGSDVVVKAFVPCFVAADVKIRHRPGYIDTHDPELVRRLQHAVAGAVNDLPASVPRLNVARVVDAVHRIVGDSAFVEMPLFLRGRVLAPTGAEISVRDSDSLGIPTDRHHGVSRVITAFYMYPDAVGIYYEEM